MTYQHILYSVEHRIATITLNRPDKLNAWTDIMEREVRQAMNAAAADDGVRAIVLTGAGRGFCAGADMDLLKDLDPSDITATTWTQPFNVNQRLDYQTRYAFYPAISKPIMGMLNGATAGIGMVHALYCDIRFAADNAVFTTAFARRGLIAEHGLSWMLPMIVGHANAMDLLLSARKVLAPEAQAMGLVNKLFPSDQLAQATYAYVRDLVDNVSPRSMAVIKRQQYDAPFQSLAENTRQANAAMVQSFASEDFREGVAHFVEKRAAQFTGR
jgi:enoyl-CoA hydratase/carnithine racemase